jgi:DNA-directed RNA polymerase specialized sigma24 family protein
MCAESSSGQEILRSPAHAGDFAIVQQIAAGDISSWQGFLGITRQAMSESAIVLCRRSAPLRACRDCTTEGATECVFFNKAFQFMSERFKSHDWSVYSGDVSLLDYATALITSPWWQKDFDSQAYSASDTKDAIPTASADHRADLVLTWAILSDSGSALERFTASYSEDIERTAKKWCHRVIPNRVCRFCRPHVKEGCDAFQNSYVYLLNRLRWNALRAFRGRSSLSTFVSVCLHDNRWWKDFVEKETKKVKLPKALEREPELIQKLYIRIVWGWDYEEIATRLKVSREDIAAACSVLKERLRQAGLPFPSKIEVVSISGPGPDEDHEHEIDPPAPTIDLELKAEAIRFWDSLPPQDRVIVRLHVEGRSAESISEAVNVSSGHVYDVIRRVRKQMPAWFRDGSEKVAKNAPRFRQVEMIEAKTNELHAAGTASRPPCR